MFRRLARAVRYAIVDNRFLPVFSAGVFLIVIGTFTYSVSQDWKVIDAFYFSVSTLTTSSIMNPALTLKDGPIELFTALYVLVGIGILVEMARQIGAGFVKVRTEGAAKRKQKIAAKRKK